MMDQAIRTRAEEIVASLSLAEKIGQLNQEYIPDLQPETLEKLKQKIREGKIGSIIIANCATAGDNAQDKPQVDFANSFQRAAVEESRAKIPLIFGRDVIHGHETVLPIPLALSATFDPELIREGYRAVAQEAANSGIHWAFSPMIDISRDPRWGRCVEGIGEDPYLGEQVAAAVVKGFQGDDPAKRDSIAACPKHYIGYGAMEGGRDYGTSEISDYTLRNFYLKPFRSAVKAGALTVMNSFNLWNGAPTTASRYLLHDLLKEELGMDGFIVSDWGNVAGIRTQNLTETNAQSSAVAINAGLDMDMCAFCYLEHLEELVKTGAVKEETVNEAATRIIYVKLLFGLFDHPYTEYVPVDREANEAVAQKCATGASVLLKNNGVLPLSDTAKTYFLGNHLHVRKNHFGAWTLDGDVSRVSSVAQAVEKRSPAAVVQKIDAAWDDLYAACWAADTIVLVLGESYTLTGEGKSLGNIDFPAEQLEFVKKMHRLGRPMVGVFCFGRPVALEEVEPYFDAMLYAWHGGTRSAESIAAILYGDAEPSGRLPMTLPRATGQVPFYYNCYPSRVGLPYYQHTTPYRPPYVDFDCSPMYPFGYGLSYAHFTYGKASVDRDTVSVAELQAGKKITVSVEVTNDSPRDGAETVQCYVFDKVAVACRPVRELKAFRKIAIPAGKTVKVDLTLDFESFAYYHPDRTYAVDPGAFEIYVGRDCFAADTLAFQVTD